MVRWTLLLSVAILALCVVSAGADIVIDGDLADWHTTANVGSHHDGDEGSVGDNYDIDYSYTYLGDTNVYFAFDLIGDYQGSETTPADGDFVKFAFNLDEDTGTGGGVGGDPGFEYYVYWNLTDKNSPNFDFYKYDSGAWGAITPSSMDIAADATDPYQGIEMAIGRGDLENDKKFLWGVYYENETENDDRSPDHFDQRGEAPEPATLALFALGLAALYLKRRES